MEVMEGAPDPEIVVNDWGVLRRARARGLPVVLGRGLDRSVRDPRLPDVGPEHLGGDAPPPSWKQASHGASAFRALMKRFGIERIETDVPLQGLASPPPGGPAMTAHVPWGMVASGRVCLVNAWGKPASLRFVAPKHCDAPCRRFTIELRAPWSRREGGAGALPMVDAGEILPLTAVLNRRRNKLPAEGADAAPRFWQKGNTHFYKLEGEALRRALDWVAQTERVDRVVVAPELPM
ncbi:MAG: hypothetical protein GY898_24395 [Proteobacteria bacterium]|nr:hypothetical protein [Pseudomonadota bacterium]